MPEPTEKPAKMKFMFVIPGSLFTLKTEKQRLQKVTINIIILLQKTPEMDLLKNSVFMLFVIVLLSRFYSVFMRKDYESKDDYFVKLATDLRS